LSNGLLGRVSGGGGAVSDAKGVEAGNVVAVEVASGHVLEAQLRGRVGGAASPAEPPCTAGSVAVWARVTGCSGENVAAVVPFVMPTREQVRHVDAGPGSGELPRRARGSLRALLTEHLLQERFTHSSILAIHGSMIRSRRTGPTTPQLALVALGHIRGDGVMRHTGQLTGIPERPR